MTELNTPTQEPTLEDSQNTFQAQLISIDLLDPDPDNPRTQEYTQEDPGLEELANSIMSVGIINPITVTPINGRYRILAGHRRTQASRIAGLTHMPAVIHTPESPDQALMTQLVENIQRQRLSPTDLCHAVLKLKKNFKLSGAEIGRRLGRSKTWVHFVTTIAEATGVTRKAVDEGFIPDMTAAYNFTLLPQKTQEAFYNHAKETGEKILGSAILEAKRPAEEPKPYVPPAEPAERPGVYNPEKFAKPREVFVSINPDLEAPEIKAFENFPMAKSTVEEFDQEGVAVYKDYGNTWVIRTPRESLVKLLELVGKKPDNDEELIKDLQALLQS